MMKMGFGALLAGILLTAASASAGELTCVGDCKNRNKVGTDDLVTLVRIEFGELALNACPGADANNDGLGVDDLVLAVENSIEGCEGNRTPPPSRTPTPTTTAIPCPLQPGRYTVTQVEGGTLVLSSIAPFPFPAGGAIIEEVGAADANCVHPVVVPFPDGFSSPAFCSIAPLFYTTSIAQVGCGIGAIDSDGGSDFTVQEIGDSAALTSCPCDPAVRGCPNTPGTCDAGLNNDVRIDLTVGDGHADTCTGTGTANAIVSIPVHTVTWQALPDNEGNVPCPDPDGMFNPGTDSLIVEFDQILDFTTDTASSRWQDLDGTRPGDAGCGPAAGPSARPPVMGTGECLDLAARTIKTVAAGTIGSAGPPLFDLSYVSTLPNMVTGPQSTTGAVCNDPPLINLAGGTVMRCIYDCPLGTTGIGVDEFGVTKCCPAGTSPPNCQ